MVIRHNMIALNANRQFSINRHMMFDAQEKLSSGYKINRSADDAAGLSISEKMRRQIRGLNRTIDNIQDGISLCQVADGALTEVHEILQRMNELAVQAANGINSDSDRGAIQYEIDQLTSEIDRIAYNTKIFDVHPLLGDADISNTYYSIPDNALHTLKDAEIYDGHGSIRFMAEGMSYPLAGVWTDTASKPIISVRDDNGLATGPISLTQNPSFTYTDYPGQNKFVSSYNNGGISFQVELTWKKVDCSTPSESREYFEYAYNFINTSSSELTFDFWFQMDMLVGPKSDAIPNIDGTEQKNTWKWTGADIPTELTVDNYVKLSGNVNTMVNISSQYTWEGISNPPDIVISGHKNDINNYNNAMNPAISGDLGHKYPDNDYFYGIGWSQNSIGAGSSFLMENRIGLYTENIANTVSYHFKGDPPVWIQMGTNSNVGMYINICNTTARNLGINGLSVQTEKAAGEAIDITAAAIQKTSVFRSNFGSQQNRLEHAILINSNAMENTQAAESILRDTDMAEKVMEYFLINLTMQAGQSILAQANSSPEMVLQLLK